MKVHRMFIAEIEVQGIPGMDENRFGILLPDKAADDLEPILEPYRRHPSSFFDNLNGGQPPAPWALVCLDREYPLAGHITSTRPDKTTLRFTRYQRNHHNPPHDFVPDVGMLVFFTKNALREASSSSRLFDLAWQGLRDYPADGNWLALLDPLDSDWVGEVSADNHEQWFESLSAQHLNT
ncbi:MAG: hypothetical protein OSA98_05200 [Rubripirellula sp.]|nr:hypothetical protein [Rubripirellula sp.]